ncbi:hypothetical protein NYR55_14415 [Sphingomonas sp. BGYR3]|uniref:hypothetical protein n=1 Tax=Sphingomonas sp. BGYR3 TaxID=2975483 RepID=UPI0021A81443|nr:hypothetical protein [Sphingomonas sp. BGYR3]MDG5489815.1 hypothetical protein [Sphingomonas sp. BGYR3]
MRGPDAATALGRAMTASAERAGIAITIASRSSRAWASATFEGSRVGYRIEAGDDDRLSRWLAALPDAEWQLPGHLVADLAVTGRTAAAGRAAVEIEALTLIEG